MELNHYTYMTIISISSTIIGYLILIRILKSIETNSKFYILIYSFSLFSIVFFLIFLFMDVNKNRIIFEFPIFIKKLGILLAEGMIFSLATCFFFLFIIILLGYSERKN